MVLPVSSELRFAGGSIVKTPGHKIHAFENLGLDSAPTSVG